MKHLLIVLIVGLLFSCSKTDVSNVSSPVINTNYMEVNGIIHPCNSEKSGGNNSIGYYLLMDSMNLTNYQTYYHGEFEITDTALKTYTNALITGCTFDDRYVAGNQTASTSYQSLTITDNSNGFISGYFNMTAYFNKGFPSQITETVSGIFNHVKVN